jgi:hypothetical protein
MGKADLGPEVDALTCLLPLYLYRVCGQMASPIVFRWCLTQANQTSAIKCFWYQQSVRHSTSPPSPYWAISPLPTLFTPCFCLHSRPVSAAAHCVQVLLRQLYEDYWTLLERTGFRPRRYIVEENIHELARRVRWKTAVGPLHTGSYL